MSIYRTIGPLFVNAKSGYYTQVVVLSRFSVNIYHEEIFLSE